MTNSDMARGYLSQAVEILAEAERLYHAQVWNLVVRRSQEVIELALKAALRFVGLEIPRLHDVGVLLIEHRNKFPLPFGKEIDRLASISRRARREREISFYGDDEIGVPPQQLYREPDACVALEDARFVLKCCRDVMGKQE